VNMPDAPGGPTRAAPLLGEHNTQTYLDRLGLDAARVEALRAEGTL